MPVPLDEYPIHQAPVSMAYFATSDRNVYDRCIFQIYDKSGERQIISGLGVYPHLGVIDAYAVARKGTVQTVVRTSGALGSDRMDQAVGPYRIEVIEPLRSLRVTCEAPELGLVLDVTFEGFSEATEEPRHNYMVDGKVVLDACRFVQTGTWTGTAVVNGEHWDIDPAGWVGARDRSWGIRPVGEPSAPGRPSSNPDYGMWWCWVPLKFDEYSIVVILQEDAHGHRVLNEAVRLWPAASGKRPEQLGWPEVDITYRPGTRIPVGASIQLTEKGGKPLSLEVSTRGGIPLAVGCGYGGDPDWSHGTWRGEKWLEGAVYDQLDPEVATRMGYGMIIDHVAHATLNGDVGYGVFEHMLIGKHYPSGFDDWGTMAP